MTIKFSEKAHRYWLDGRPIPGVTTLIKGGIPAPALTYWAARTVAEWVADHDAEVDQLRSMGRNAMVAALKETPWTARDQAGVRGTDVHALAEELVQGREVEVPEHLEGYVNGYVDWLDRFRPEPVLVEKMIAHRKHWYAGRFDLIADINGTRWLLDVKTASGVYGDNALQCDAYRHAEFWQDDDGNEQPMPEGIERLGVIHVQPSGSQLVPLRSDGEAFRDFLHAAWTGRREKQRKAYVGEPITDPETTETEDAA